MVNEQTAPIRAPIVLEGGGRLEDVLQVAQIRLELDHVDVRPIAPDTAQVSGAINAYIYCLRQKGQRVEGQGVRIPFTRHVATGGYDPAALVAEVERLESDHDFNPITKDFHHTVRAVVALRLKEEKVTARGRPQEPPGATRSPEAFEAPEASELPPAPPREGSRRSSDETRISQVRRGSSLPGERRLPPDEAPPASTRPPAAEEFESLRQALAAEQERRLAPHPVPGAASAEEPPRSRAKEEEKPAASGASPAKQNAPLVWKPFPPPLTSDRRRPGSR